MSQNDAIMVILYACIHCIQPTIVYVGASTGNSLIVNVINITFNVYTTYTLLPVIAMYNLKYFTTIVHKKLIPGTVYTVE